MNIFKLVGSVSMKGTSDVEGQLDTIDKKGKKAGSSFASLGKFAQSAGKMIGVAAVGFAAFGVAVTKIASSSDVIDKMSQKIGISTTAYQEWSFAMSQSGVDINKLKEAMVKITTSTNMALKGNKDYQNSFKELGVELTDANGNMLDQETLLNNSISALADMEDVTKRSIIGTKLFGETFSDLNPLLNSGSDGINNLKNQAHELGLVLGEDSVAAGVKFTDAVDKMKRSASALLGSTMAPIMGTLTDMINKALEVFKIIQPKIAEFVAKVSALAPKISAVVTFVVNVIGIMLKYLGYTLRDTLTYLKTLFNPFIDWLKAFWETNGTDILSVISNTWNIIETAIDIALDTIKSIFAIFGMALKGDWAGVWNEVQTMFSRVWDSIPAILENAFAVISSVFTIIKDTIGNILNDMFGLEVSAIYTTFADNMILIYQTLKDSILLIMTAFSQAFQGDWSGLWETVQTIFTNIWETIKTVAKTSIDAISNLVIAPITFITTKFTELKDSVVNSISEMVTDINEWFSETKLGKSFAWVGEQTDKVSGFFLNMWEKVTRHSYVPDMVNEIGVEFDKLQKAMTDPAKIATEETTEAFKTMGEKSVEAMDTIEKRGSTMFKAMKGFASGVGSAVLGVAGGVGSAIVGASPVLSGAVEGFKSGGVSKTTGDDGEEKTAIDMTGGLIGAFVNLITSSEAFGELMESLSPLLEIISEAFGEFIKPLMPIVDILVTKLSPLFEKLSPLFSILGEVFGIFIRIIIGSLMPVFSLLEPVLDLVIGLLENVVLPIIKLLYKGFVFVFNGVANVINGIIRAINKVPFVDISWRMPTMASDLPDLESTVTEDTNSTEDEKSTTRTKAGTQISEITGQTRDLLTDILSPLASLNTLTGIGSRIYDLLDERMVSGMGGGITISNVTINTNGVDGSKLGSEFMDAVESELKKRTVSSSRGFANA